MTLPGDSNVDLPREQEDVLYVLALYGPLQVEQVRDRSGVRGRTLAGALSALRLRGLAWRGVSGAWRTTEAGWERGKP